MRHQLPQSTIAAALTICLLSVSQESAYAAPGSLGQTPLFIATPTQPNIFFMLDDSGSMHWSMPTDGVSSEALIWLDHYDTMPDDDQEWRVWCLGANFMAYDPTITYTPWAANKPGTSTPFPNQTDLKNVWVNPLASGTTIDFKIGENNGVRGGDNEIIDLSAAPVVQWTDTDNDGLYDAGECPGGDATTGYLDARVRRADALSATEQINFANWFSYYRIREHATKAAVTQVISTSSARMGMSTLHNNSGVGVEIKDMGVTTNKEALLEDVVQFNSSGGTPLRDSLNQVGQYFDQASTTPSSLNISTATADKPILSAANGGECQQNFTMLMTDGQWNGSSPGVGQHDNTIDNNYVYPAHQDSTSDTLADVALKWYKKDLSTTLGNKVPVQTGASTQNLDENTQQHMVTFGVAFGPSGTINNDPVDRTLAFTWPTPTSNANTTVDDLRHAAYNGRGQFLSANNPQSLITALQNVITDIESRQGSASAVSFSSTSLVSGTSLFFASFDTNNWTGDLRAFTIDPLTGVLGASPLWNAASILDGKTNADMLNRVIYTSGIDSAGNKDGVLFNWSTVNPQPDSDILDDLKINQNLTTDTTPFLNSQIRLNFLRGDTSNDGVGLIRNRQSRLGDIINSAPRFVGSPISNWPDTDPFGATTSRYSGYQSTLVSTPRDAIVYVGANDGLLHGFNSSNGEEVIAYVPSSTASANDNSGLHHLSEIDYQHRYYVDGVPISADVYIKTDPAGTKNWRTVLIGSLGGGGQGLYALDVTDPSQFQQTQTAAEDLVLWEFTNQDDADLGYSFSVPQLTMMNNNEWAVIVGNGYNASGTDTAKLMIIFIEKGVDGLWTAGDYIKLDTNIGTVANKNGLSTPTLLDLDSDGTTDRVYAGDLHGNMWAFDVSDSSTANWQIAHTDASLNPAPLFSAGTTKPITMKPLVVKPNVSTVTDDTTNVPNYMVYFGTGQYLATGDSTNTDQQSFYGIWDAGGIEVPASKLVQQTFLPGFPATARVLSQNSVALTSPPTLPSAGTELGWFIDFPESGERVVVDAFELEGLIFFNTLTASSAPCSAGGNSWLMAVDMETGGNPTIAAFDLNGDRNLDSSDQVTDGSNNHYAAGVVFGHGIASATSVITNSDGYSFGFISGTDSDETHLYDLPGGGVTGTRRTWIQLFN